MRLKVLENRPLRRNVFSLKVDNPGLFEVNPGQFFMIRVNDYPFPLLRRPFSVANFGNFVEFIYRVVGEGTKILSEKREGDFLDILGPFGNGFKIVSTKELILVGGGIGVAPLLYLKRIIEDRYKLGCKTYFGFDSEDEIFSNDGEIATMDGSVGFVGSVVDMVENKLNKNVLVYACGPSLMLKKLAFLCFENGCSMQVSLESRMACGMGVCLGCVVRVNESGFKKVCVDGPVFDFEEIQWQVL